MVDAKRINELEAQNASLRRQVTDLHDGLNALFKEALALRNENRRLKSRIKELEERE